VLAELHSGMSSVVYTTVRAWAVSGKGTLNPMSAFGGKADMARMCSDVGF